MHTMLRSGALTQTLTQALAALFALLAAAPLAAQMDPGAQTAQATAPVPLPVSPASGPLRLDQAMGAELARQMLGRWGYGPTRRSVQATALQSPAAYLRQGIVGSSVLPASVQAQIDGLPSSQPAEQIWVQYGPGSSLRAEAQRQTAQREGLQEAERQLAQGAIAERLLRMANSDNPAHEVLLSFWLNHFSIYAAKNLNRLLAADYARQLEAAMPKDSFEALLRASFYHPAMQIYLDNNRSTAPDSLAGQEARRRQQNLGINENLARELMELHTLGVDGAYTQADVQELARIITGAGVWRPRQGERALGVAGAERQGLFLFEPRRHDSGAKTLLGQRFAAGQGRAEIDQALHLLAQHPDTARHISRQLALRFVSDQPSEALIAHMRAAYLRSQGQISAVLLAMVETAEFADSLRASAKFKEPLDQLLSSARAVCQNQPIGNVVVLRLAAADQGQSPMMRTTPDGYGSREADWLSPAAVAKRVRWALGLGHSRLPLAEGQAGSELRRFQPRMNESPQALQGTPCAPQPDAVQAALGPLSANTQAALQGLGAPERVAVLLASPEAMQR